MNYSSDADRRNRIGPTLRRASDHPFYREHWGSLCATLAQLPADASPEALTEFLSALPPTGQRDMVDRLSLRCDPDDEIIAVSYSTGSTGGPKLSYSTAREARLLASVPGEPYLSPGELAVLRPAVAPRPLTLRFIRAWNAWSNMSSTDALQFPASIDCDLAVQRAAELLSREFNLPGYRPRIEILGGSLEAVRVFTRYLMDTRVHASIFAVRELEVFGMYSGASTRRWLESYWACAISDNFSISECAGGGVICPRCGFIDFDCILWPGVIHLTDDKVVTAGQGRLVLTSLLPAGIAQPLVKYMTGDVVEWIAEGDGCESHVGGLRRLGRAEYSCIGQIDQDAILLLGSQDLHDALDIPGIDRSHPYLRLSSIRTNDVYAPRGSMRCERRSDGGYAITVSYRPESGVNTDLRGVILDRLQSMRRVAPLVRSGALDITVRQAPDAPVFTWKFA